MNRKPRSVYAQAKRHGVSFAGSCTSISYKTWESRMVGARHGNRKIIEDLVKATGALDPDMFKFHNPYHHWVTDKYLIYVHSGIEYFFKVNTNDSD